MKVRTISGGFRGLADGLASLTEVQRDGVRRPFTERTATFMEAYEHLLLSYNAGTLRQIDIPLVHEADTVSVQIGEMLAQLERLESEVMLAEWQVTASRMATNAEKLARRIRYALGEESAMRGVRIALLAAGSIAVFGGIGWAAWKLSR